MSNYQTVTQMTINAHKALHAHATKPAVTVKLVSSVAAVISVTTMPNWTVESASIETIAAVLLQSPDIDRTGSDTIDNLVSCAPLIAPHFLWNVLIDGPNVSAPEIILTLIDSGSHLVLIDSGLVDHLGLCQHPLHKPISIDVALNTKQTNSTMLSKYCKISVTSSNRQWTSCSLQAVIAPKLYVPVTLGLPFLKSNAIVLDTEAGTVMDK